ELLPDNACDRIGAAAGSERHHDGDRLVWIGLGGDCAGRECNADHDKAAGQTVHDSSHDWGEPTSNGAAASLYESAGQRVDSCLTLCPIGVRPALIICRRL